MHTRPSLWVPSPLEIHDASLKTKRKKETKVIHSKETRRKLFHLVFSGHLAMNPFFLEYLLLIEILKHILVYEYNQK